MSRARGLALRPAIALLSVLALRCADGRAEPEIASIEEAASGAPSTRLPPSAAGSGAAAGRAAAREAADPRAHIPPARAIVWIGGDVLVSEAIADFVEDSGAPAEALAELIEPVSTLWRQDTGASLVLLNLETPIAAIRRRDRLQDQHERRSPEHLAPIRLNAERWLAAGLARAGVGAVMLANNHALDQEREGLAETIEAAHGAGLETVGAGIWPEIVSELGIGEESARICILAFYEGLRREPPIDPGVAGLSMLDEGSLEKVERASRRGDTVVVVIHVLGELLEAPKPRWRQWARRLAERGADAVAMHGTHLVMEVEQLSIGERSVPIAYGLGNFISDMGRLASPRRSPEPGRKEHSAAVHEGLMMRIEREAGEAPRIGFVPIWMSDDRFVAWHASRPASSADDETAAGGLISFALWPLAACGEPFALPAQWNEPARGEMMSWIAGRRDHLLEISGLVPSRCDPGRRGVLELSPSAAEPVTLRPR
ncbi:MAG: CapA family protein [Myxococcales bacterium]|nr:CapA family protein [Myxococcales bacterium]